MRILSRPVNGDRGPRPSVVQSPVTQITKSRALLENLVDYFSFTGGSLSNSFRREIGGTRWLLVLLLMSRDSDLHRLWGV